MKTNSILIIILIELLLCNCNRENSVFKLKYKNNFAYLVRGKDSIQIGNTYLNKNTFEISNSCIYSSSFANEYEFQIPDANFAIEGVYINNNFFDAFTLNNGELKKDNCFDIIILYPEIERNNFRSVIIKNYKIIEFYGFSYSDPSPFQNLPNTIDSIYRIDLNKIGFSHIDTINKLNIKALQVFPKIIFELENKQFQRSKYYIKLSNEFLSDINIKLQDGFYLPQDITEIYVDEIITKLLNKRFGINCKKEDYFKILKSN